MCTISKRLAQIETLEYANDGETPTALAHVFFNNE